MDCLSNVINLVGNISRSSRCLPTYTDSYKVQNFFLLLRIGKSILIHMSLFWPHLGSKRFYQNGVSNCSTPQIAKCPSSCISGLLVLNKSVEKIATARQRKSAQSPCQTRSCYQARNISLSPKSKSNLYRGSFSVGQRNSMHNIRENSENRKSNYFCNSRTNSIHFSPSFGFNGLMHRTGSQCAVIHETDTASSPALLEACNRRTLSKRSNNPVSVRSFEMV